MPTTPNRRFHQCKRCKYRWGALSTTKGLPKRCANCRSSYWNTKRTRKVTK